MPAPRIKTHVFVPLVYSLVGCGWILFSDLLFLGEAVGQDILSLSTLKGFGFVAVTAGILFVFLRKEHRRRQTYEREILTQSALQRAITDASPLPLYSLTPEGVVTSWNTAAERLFGWSAEEAVGQILPIVPPEDMETFNQILQRVLNGEAFAGVELRRRRKDGGLLDVSLSTAPILDVEGGVSGVMVSLEDITTRKANDRLIRKLNRLYALRSAINQAIVRIREPRALHAEVCRIVAAEGRFAMAWLVLRDHHDGALRSEAGAGGDEAFFNALLEHMRDNPESPIVSAVREGCATVAQRTDALPAAERDHLRQRGARAMAVFPLRVFGACRGVFTLFSYEEDFFDAEEVQHLGGLAEDLAMAMEFHEQDRLRRQAERLLQVSESRYRSLFENNHAAMLLVDPESGRIVDANPAACTYYGWSRDELTERVIHDINIADTSAVKAEMARAQRMEASRLLMKHRLAGGEVRDVEVYTGPIHVGGQDLLYSLIFDVTERVRAETDLLEAKEAAEAASRTKSEFLANMSHELRTPLNGVLGMLQLLQTTAMNAEQQEYVAVSIKSANRLTQLLSDILDIAQAEAGELSVHDEPFDLHDLLEDLRLLFAPVAQQSGVALRFETDPALPRRLRGDAVRLKQVLANLVGNAFKFTKAGSVTVETTPLGPLRQDHARVYFAVKDTGPGVPQEKIDALFAPFTQASKGFRREHQGAGLGLAICKRLIGMLGGGLTVTSEPGAGAAFAFALTFPVEEDIPAQWAARTHDEPSSHEEARTYQAPPALASGGSAPKGDRPHDPAQPPAPDTTDRRPLRLLIAEDDTTTRYATTRLLENAGYIVVAAKDGREALETLRREHFDLALLDIQMPVMDGLEALRALRRGEAGRANVSLPVVVMTAYVGDADRKTFLAAGADEYVPKPLTIQTLRAAMTRALKRLAHAA